MGDDFGSSSNPQIGGSANRMDNTGTPFWRRLTGGPSNPARRPSRSIGWILFVLPIIFALGVVAAFAWYAARPNGLRKAPVIEATSRIRSFLVANGSKPKPAPGKPFQAPPPPVPSTYVPLPAPAVQPSQPTITDVPVPAQNLTGSASTPIAPTTPLAPVVPTARAPFSPLTYRARHDKVFGGSCSGQLILNSGGLVFNCSDDPHGSMQIALSEIGAVDENGVRLLSGKKYHFSISGMSKSGEEALFANWLHQVR